MGFKDLTDRQLELLNEALDERIKLLCEMRDDAHADDLFEEVENLTADISLLADIMQAAWHERYIGG